jgi:HEXXH motif-containing protein
MKQGQWISHKDGAAKISACAHVFFQSCIDRIQLPDHSGLNYQPWMAAPDLVTSVIASGRPIHDFCTTEILNLSAEYGENVNSLLRFVAEQDGQKGSLDDVRVFSEIADCKNQKFREIFAEALRLTEHWSPWMQVVFKRVVKSIVPVVSIKDNSEGFSFTDHNFIGAIFASVDTRTPYPGLLLNTFLAHELGHNALMIYQHAGNFFYESDEWIYSGIRKTLRPVVASFHAAVALAYLIDCTSALLKSRTDVAEKAYRVHYEFFAAWRPSSLYRLKTSSNV